MNLDGVRVETSSHARDRYRERIAAHAPYRGLVRMLEASHPRREYDYRRSGTPGASTHHVHPDGWVLVVEWLSPTALRVVTVFWPTTAEVQVGAA